MSKIKKAIHPDDDMHYEKMGLDRKTVALWEDGSRVEGKRGEYEWWYCDSHYPDGTILVIFFFSKMPISVNGPVKPISTMELTLPDGRKLSEEVCATVEKLENSTAVETVSDPAVWELMYFGKSCGDEKYREKQKTAIEE